MLQKVLRNWLIRTKDNQILGPVSRDKIMELMEQGHLDGLDEICSGNGYWFRLEEKDLIKKFLFDQIKQPFNLVSEARVVVSHGHNKAREKASERNQEPSPIENNSQTEATGLINLALLENNVASHTDAPVDRNKVDLNIDWKANIHVERNQPKPQRSQNGQIYQNVKMEVIDSPELAKNEKMVNEKHRKLQLTKNLLLAFLFLIVLIIFVAVYIYYYYVLNRPLQLSSVLFPEARASSTIENTPTLLSFDFKETKKKSLLNFPPIERSGLKIDVGFKQFGFELGNIELNDLWPRCSELNTYLKVLTVFASNDWKGSFIAKDQYLNFVNCFNRHERTIPLVVLIENYFQGIIVKPSLENSVELLKKFKSKIEPEKFTALNSEIETIKKIKANANKISYVQIFIEIINNRKSRESNTEKIKASAAAKSFEIFSRNKIYLEKIKTKEGLWPKICELAIALDTDNLAWMKKIINAIIQETTLPFLSFNSQSDFFIEEKDKKDFIDALSHLVSELEIKLQDSVLIKIFLTKIYEVSPDYFSGFKYKYDVNWSLSELRKMISSPYWGVRYFNFWFDQSLERLPQEELTSFVDSYFIKNDLSTIPFDYFYYLQWHLPKDKKLRKAIVDRIKDRYFHGSFHEQYLAISLMKIPILNYLIKLDDEYFRKALFQLERKLYLDALKQGTAIDFCLYQLTLLGDDNLDYLLWKLI